MSEQVIRIELDGNMLKAVRSVLEAVDNENRRCGFQSLSPGLEVQKAFGIDIAKVTIINKGGQKNENSR